SHGSLPQTAAVPQRPGGHRGRGEKERRCLAKPSFFFLVGLRTRESCPVLGIALEKFDRQLGHPPPRQRSALTSTALQDCLAPVQRHRGGHEERRRRFPSE